MTVPPDRPKPTARRARSPQRPEAPPSKVKGNRTGPVARGAGPGNARSVASRDSTVEALHVAPLEVLAREAARAAQIVDAAVFEKRTRADRAIAKFLRNRRDLALPDQRFIARSVFALFRWHGWLEPLRLMRMEERLLLAWLLDAPRVHPVCRVWGHEIGRDAGRLVALGDAPNWTARAEGLKRWNDGQAVNADPWALFPKFLREQIALSPGLGSAKTRYLDALAALQKPPSLWLRAQGGDAKAIWSALRDEGVQPWVHRKMPFAAKIEDDADVHHMAAFSRGEIEIQDVASQAVGLVCDPDAGERWWDACAGAGGKSLHLAALMQGKGAVVATDTNAARLDETARRARRTPYRNLTTKLWEGKHVAGKTRSFDGVLVDAPLFWGIGNWRRNPDARWVLDADAIPRLVELQLQLLTAASAGVKPGGVLVYSVCTLTVAETQAVVSRFLERNESFQLDPFTEPLSGGTTIGTHQIWPQDGDCDGMFIARFLRVRG